MRRVTYHYPHMPLHYHAIAHHIQSIPTYYHYSANMALPRNPHYPSVYLFLFTETNTQHGYMAPTANTTGKAKANYSHTLHSKLTPTLLPLLLQLRV
jgi:hypothetical protein